MRNEQAEGDFGTITSVEGKTTMKNVLIFFLTALAFPAGSFAQAGNKTFGPILFVSRQVHDGSSFGMDKLYAMNEDGTNIRQVITDSFRAISDAKWLHDGKDMVVAADSLFTVNVNGGVKRSFHCGARTVVVSPDGKKIVFDKYLGGTDPPMYSAFRMNLDGTEERELHIQNVSDWSPDGKSLAGWTYKFYPDPPGSRSDNYFLHFYDTNGKVIKTWEQGRDSVQGIWAWHPIYSSKGDRIAFISNKGAERQGIYTMDSDCTGDTVLTSKQYVFNEPVAWSPDDTKLLYNAGPAGINIYGRVCIIDIRTKHVNDITPFNSDSTYSFAVSWRKRIN